MRNLEYNGLVTIYIGKSRKETNWRKEELRWSELLDRLSKTNYIEETFEGDPKGLTSFQSREINDILRKLEGWEAYSKGTGKLRFVKTYGLQKASVRTDFSLE